MEDIFQHHLLMPVPAVLRTRPGRLVIDSSLKIAVSGHSDERLRAAINRAATRLEGRTGFELERTPGSDQATATLLINCRGPGREVASLDEDESYSLNVSPKQAVLSAPTVVGVLRGLETFLQLLQSDRDGYFMPTLEIEDKPRFPWRGLLIDVARHFHSVEVLNRNLDAMAAVKMNVLHWHLTDDQGFRIESRKYPKLHLMGSDGLYYTQDQARGIIAYARDRGIRVVPEFDMPGHATSWLVGHPELGSAPGPYQIERKAGIFESALDPTNENVYKLLDGFLDEMAALFPDAYLHIGGDEVKGKQWKRNPKIAAFMRENGIPDNLALQAYFNQRVSQILKKYGKKMMGWDEILHPDLPKDVVIHSWRGPASLIEAVKKGYSGILSAGYYIDLLYPASKHYGVDPVAADGGLSSEQVSRILGGEATMWGEYVSPETIDSRIWPRTAAIAERLWSAANVNDVGDMYRRLQSVSIQLEELGLTHERNSALILRRLAGSRRIQPLEVLVSVLEPVKESKHRQMRPTTMLTPLTSLVDAARPDSKAARDFAAMVDEFLSAAPRFQAHQRTVQAVLTEWRDVQAALNVMLRASPALREAEPLAKDLSDVAFAGLEAIDYLGAGAAPTQEWREGKLALLAEAARPKAALELVIVSSIRQLVIAAAEISELNTTTPAQWRERVRTLAVESA